MGYPKVFERPVGTTPDAAYAIARAWLHEIGAKAKREAPPSRIEAVYGHGLRLVTQESAKKFLNIDFLPIPAGTLVRVTMPLSTWHIDDGHMMEDAVVRSWARFVDGLWVRLGYPPSAV